MARHINPITGALAFLALALAVHAYSAGEAATAWLMALSYMGGFISGILLTMLILERD